MPRPRLLFLRLLFLRLLFLRLLFLHLLFLRLLCLHLLRLTHPPLSASVLSLRSQPPFSASVCSASVHPPSVCSPSVLSLRSQPPCLLTLSCGSPSITGAAPARSLTPLFACATTAAFACAAATAARPPAALPVHLNHCLPTLPVLRAHLHHHCTILALLARSYPHPFERSSHSLLLRALCSPSASAASRLQRH